MTTLLSIDPAAHPIAEERIGFVDGQIMLIHAARDKGGDRVWSDRAGDRVKPAWVRDLVCVFHAIELANHLAETAASGGAHLATALLSNWRAGIDDPRLDGFERHLENWRLAAKERAP